MRSRWRRGRGRGAPAALAVLAALGAAPDPAGAQGGRELPRSPVVVDANGQVLGAAVGRGVRLRVGGRVARLDVGRDQFLRGSARVVFESTDCSGSALLDPSLPPGAAGLLQDVGVGPPNRLLGPGGPVETRTIRSTWVAGVTPPSCFSQPAAPTDVVPAVTLMDLDVFTPPFRLE